MVSESRARFFRPAENFSGKRHGLPLRANQITLTPAGCISIFYSFLLFLFLFLFFIVTLLRLNVCVAVNIRVCLCVLERGFTIHYAAALAHSFTPPPPCYRPRAAYSLNVQYIYRPYTRISQLNGGCKAVQDLESFNQPLSLSLYILFLPVLPLFLALQHHFVPFSVSIYCLRIVCVYRAVTRNRLIRSRRSGVTDTVCKRTAHLHHTGNYFNKSKNF